MIKIRNLEKEYLGEAVLNNVSLDIPKGTILGILGPNGAGKTTLIRILTGIIKADSGEISMDGYPIAELGAHKIGYLPEERGLYKRMKVGEESVYLSVLKGLSSQEAERRLKLWFQKMGISDWWEKRTETLSKGMQQKIQFIISIIHQPDLLILDEPFSGLDPINRELFGNEILDLNKSGMTILLSTHDMNSVEQFCDSVILINKGNVILSGKVNEIKQTNKQFIYKFCFSKNYEKFINQCTIMGAKVLSSENNNNIFCVKVKFQNDLEAEILLKKVIGEIGLSLFQEILPSMHDIFVESITCKGDIKH